MVNVPFTLTATDEAGHSTSVALTLAVQQPSSARFYGDPGPTRVYVGASAPAPATLTALETAAGGKKLGVRIKFETTANSSHATDMKNELALGRVPWWSFKPDGTYIGCSSSATKRNAIRSQARAVFDDLVNAVGPCKTTWFHEPENDGSATDAQRITDWLLAQQIIMEEKVASGVTKVSVVANLQSYTFIGSSNGRNWQGWADAMAPCDIVGFNRYHQEDGNDPEDALASAEEFQAAVARIKSRLPGKPIAFREVGIDRRQGNTKMATEWADLVAFCRDDPDVVAVSYFNSDPDSGSLWALDSTERITAYNNMRTPAWSVTWQNL